MPHLRLRLPPLVAAVVLTACAPDREPHEKVRLNIRDSIRVRRAAAMETRPDTFGLRVDSARVLRATPPDGRAVPWVVVFSDFQCAECRRLARDVLPVIRRDVTEGGTANLAFVAAPQEGHFNARFAALAALCAGAAGRFWAMHDTVFATLPRWDRDPDPQAYLDSLAVAVGVPAEGQRRCTGRGRLLRLLEDDLRRSAQVGALELPAVFVGDRRLSPPELTVAGLRAAITAASVR